MSPRQENEACSAPAMLRNVININDGDIREHLDEVANLTVAAILKEIHASQDRAAAQEKVRQVAAKLREMKLPAAAALIDGSIHETLSYYAFPREHHRSVRTNNPLERIMKEIRRRTRVVGAFPDGNSALILVSARLRHIAGTEWGRADIWTWNG